MYFQKNLPMHRKHHSQLSKITDYNIKRQVNTAFGTAHIYHKMCQIRNYSRLEFFADCLLPIPKKLLRGAYLYISLPDVEGSHIQKPASSRPFHPAANSTYGWAEYAELEEQPDQAPLG